MKIEIEIDETRVEEQVIQELTDRLLPGYSSDSLRTLVKKAMDQTVLERLNKVLEQQARDLLSRPIQKYDTFGNKVGEPVSIEMIIQSGANIYLTELVDSNGKPSNSQYETRKTRLQWVLERVAIDGLSKEIKAEAETLKLELQKKATAAAAQLITQIKV